MEANTELQKNMIYQENDLLLVSLVGLVMNRKGQYLPS